MMRLGAAFLTIALGFSISHVALADQAEAKEVARINNCTPKKIEIYQQSMGTEGQTVYRVQCTVPKTVDPNAPKGPDALLIGCRDSMCELLRPVDATDKK